MKSKLSCFHLSIIFFFLTLVLTLFSWIGSIYGLGEVQSLLSAEGIRWYLGHVVENYVQCPALGIVLVLSMGVGVGIQAGLFDVLKRFCKKEKQLSRKERRALTLASVALLVYVTLVGGALLLPWNFLHGVTGSWFYSPFAKGFVYLLAMGMGLGHGVWICLRYVPKSLRCRRRYVMSYILYGSRFGDFIFCCTVLCFARIYQFD